jgi:hypothetical protein
MSNDYTYSPTNFVRIVDLSPGSSSSEEFVLPRGTSGLVYLKGASGWRGAGARV